MIEVRLRYFETNNELFSDHEVIGFWSWKAFVQHFNRLYRWKIMFEVTEINGSDEFNGTTYWDIPITSECTQLVDLDPLLKGKPTYNLDEFLQQINRKVNSNAFR